MAVAERIKKADKLNTGSVAEQLLAGERLFIGIYRSGYKEAARNSRAPKDEEFCSYAGRMSDLLPEIPDNYYPGLGLADVARMPLAWQADMEKAIGRYSASYNPRMPLVPLGHIYMTFTREDGEVIARTDEYAPKEVFFDTFMYPRGDMNRAAPGLGYATEFAVLSVLRDRVTHVSTTRSSYSTPREGQLAAVGLPVGEKVPIGEWLRGMEEGFVRSMRKARHEQQVQHI
ncbi:MAG: hypothetical protein KGH72_06070 [Candidatus Micrarchaeota archaeon]|nr:hypothetical protein [Candidatus Micrarchaeota archaeon]